MFGMMVITNAGAALVRQAASAEKKIVFTRSCYGSSWDDSRADLANKPADWYDVGVGTILGVSAGSGGLKVVAQHAMQLIPGSLNPNPKDPSPVIIEARVETDAPKPVKAVCICAQIKKDGADPEYDPQDDVIFAATCNDNSCFTWADPFTVDFDLPIPMSAVVDDTGSTSGDYVTLDTKQTITGAKTIDNTLEINPDGGSNGILIGKSFIGDQSIFIRNSAETSECEYGYDGITLNADITFEFISMPLQCEYNTTNKTVDLMLGNGTVVRLTCTNVEENPE